RWARSSASRSPPSPPRCFRAGDRRLTGCEFRIEADCAKVAGHSVTTSVTTKGRVMVAATWLRLATAIVLSTVGAARAAAATKVACVGDSITVGARSSTPGKTYPAQLGVLLGVDFQVMNFGVGGTTLLRSGDSPYVNTPQYGASGTFAPDIV